MRFIVSSLKLLKSLQALGGVIGSKNTLPILDDFLFQLNENELKITASDLDVTMSVAMKPEMVEGIGEVTIPARLLLEIMKNFPDVPITVSVDNNTLAVELTAGEGRYKLAGHKSDEFPQLPVMTETSVWEIPADVMARGFEKTVFATGMDEIRPIMSGVLLEMTENYLTFVEDTLALIWLRLSPCSYIGCIIANQSLIDALYYDSIGIRCFSCNSFRILELDRV